MRIWQRQPDCGPLAYLFDLIQNLRSGSWIENCPQTDMPKRRPRH